jgi:TolB-like protein
LRAAQLFALGIAVGCLHAAPAAAGSRVVMLPVVVHSAASDPGYVSRGLSDMLSARLEQLGGIDVIRADGSAPATSRLPEALAAARDAGGDYVLFGSFTQFGDGASLDIQCASVAEGGPPARTIFIQSGSMGEIIPKLDDLADKVARYVRGEPVAAADPASNGDAGADLDGLKRRLDALERAVFPPVAGAAESAAGEESDGAGAAEEPTPES